MKYCQCCTICNQVNPCDSVQAGGFCDEFCECEEWEDDDDFFCFKCWADIEDCTCFEREK